MTKLDKLYNALENAFGHYLWIDDDYDNEVEIQVADMMADECEDLIERYGFEIIEQGEFDCSDFDCVRFMIKVA